MSVYDGTTTDRRDDLVSMLGEGFHTAFRKAVDSVEAVEIWNLINRMDGEDWHSLLEWIADGLEPWLIDAYGPSSVEKRTE